MALDSRDHTSLMRLALLEAQKSPPLSTNFSVGAVLFDPINAQILSTGYTLELTGNTHAEQNALTKYAAGHGVPEEQVGDVLPEGTVLYTTMEPCVERKSGNRSCVERVLNTQRRGKGGIVKIYSGVREPEIFVGENRGRKRLEEEGIECVFVEGFEEEILKVATRGHGKGQGQAVDV